MAATTREELRRLVDTLPESTLEKAHADLNRLLNGLAEDDETAFDREMLRAGFLVRVPKERDAQQFDAFQPIRVMGEPVSKTIVDERR